MKRTDTADESSLLRALARGLMLNSSDDNEEPTLDTFRGFRDPNEYRCRSQPDGWYAQDQYVRPI